MSDSAPVSPAPILAGPTPEADARERGQACQAEVAAVLAKHRCALISVLNIDQVGQDGSKALTTATPQVVPLR